MTRKYTPQSRSWQIWTAALMVIGLTVLILVVLSRGTEDQSVLPLNTTSAEDHTRGNKSAKVVLVEYGDYQCPACAAYDPLVGQLVETYGERVLFVYRQFPLRAIHPNADLAARAAEAAGLQGKFFEMHKLLYAGQLSWEGDTAAKKVFVSYAASLGLDTARFEKDMDSAEVKTKIERDLASGMAANIPGTPTFFVDGKSIQNPGSYEAFAVILDQALKPFHEE